MKSSKSNYKIVKFHEKFYRATPFYGSTMKNLRESDYICLHDFETNMFSFVALVRQVEPATDADVLEDRMCAT